MRVIPAFIHIPDGCYGPIVPVLLDAALKQGATITLDETTHDRLSPNNDIVFDRESFDALPEAKE